MRYRSPHAADGGRVPRPLRGSKPARTAIAAAVAGAIGFVPVVMFATPAFATASTLSSPTVVEGQDLVYTFTYNGTSAATYNLAFGGGGSTATGTGPNADYTVPTTTQLNFGAGVAGQTATITVKTTSDTMYEGDETLRVTATNAADGTDVVTGTGTIQNDDNAPTYTLTASPNPVAEDAGTTTVTATLSAASGFLTTFALTTTDGTAKAGTNFQSNITNLTIPAGSTTGTQTVAITNDHVHDAVSPMTFTVNGSGDNVTGRYQSTQIGITDVTPMPTLTLVAPSPSTTAEGSTATWTVNADYASSQAITVDWSALATTPASGHAAATPGDDFTYPATGRTVTIPAGSTSTTISIPITQDNQNELSEDYTIGLSNPVNAVLGQIKQAIAVISSATAAPTVAVTPTAVTEGDSGTRTQTFTATLSAKSGRTVTVNWNTADNTAWAGYDYVAASGVLTFPAGTTTQTFTVDIIGDKVYEPGNETFKIQLAAPLSESPPSLSVTADNTITITDDDSMPTISVADQSVTEGDVTKPVLVPLVLSNPSNQTVTVTIADTPAGTTSRTPGVTPGANDYGLLNTTVTIPPGQVNGYAVILVNGDTTYEPDEATSLAWNASNVATPTSGTATFTILNDDKAPNLDINDVSGHPGDTVTVTGTVTGMSQTSTILTVTFAGQASGGKVAAGPADFTNPGGQSVTIAAGTAPGTIKTIATVQLAANAGPAPAKTIVASGIGNNNIGTVTDGVVTIQAVGTPPPTNTPPTNAPPTTTPPTTTAPTISAPAMINGAGTVHVTGMATEGATVDIWGGPWTAGMPALTKIGSATAGSNGAYSFERWIGSGYRFKAAVGDKMSAEVKTEVNQMPLFIAGSPSKGMVSLAVQGNPRAAGQSVIVQRWSGGAWVNTWHGTTGSDNLWKATAKEASKSVWTLRAWVSGDASMGLNAGYSSSVKVTVK